MVSALAQRIVEAGGALPAEALRPGALAMAWALKDQCYAAWSSEPARAAMAADALQQLCSYEACRDATPAQCREISALAAWTAGVAQITRGEMAQATSSFDEAAQIFRSLHQNDHAAQTQVPKIAALSMQGMHAEAARCAEQTQRELLALGNLRAASRVSLNLGGLQLRRDAYPQAARHYRDAAVLFARVRDHEHSVIADIGLADALASMGEFEEALRIYARARMRSATHGFPVQQARVDESVALLELVRGRFREALAGFEAARSSYERLAMPQHLAVSERQLADAYLEVRMLPEALALFDQALDRFAALHMPDDQAWALAQRGRALALLAQPAAAADSFMRASTLFAAHGNGVGQADVTLARAELALANGDADRAELLARQAARGFHAQQQAEGSVRAEFACALALLNRGNLLQARELFDSTLGRARQLQLLPVQVRCLSGLGCVAQALHDPAAARDFFCAAIELFEDQRRALPGDDLRSAFLHDHLRPYEELLRMALEAHARGPTPGLATDVLNQLDRFRARSLDERLAQDRGPGRDDTRGLRERLDWLYRRVQRLEDEGEPSAAMADEVRRTERELLERARRSRIAAPAADRDRRVDDHFTVAGLQALLGEDGALVEYGVLDDELFACVVTRAGVRLHRHVARWSGVLEALRGTRFQIDTLRHGAAPVQLHMDLLARRAQLRLQQLHALVWAPLVPALADARRVLVVPHAQLGWLPFAALHDGECFIGQHLALAVAPSARLAMRGLARPARQPVRVLALGESSRLPHAAPEARFVAGLFPQGDAFVGAQATLETFRAHAGQADVVHLACHAQFRSDNPMFSALHLHDSVLTVEEAESISLLRGIVVLSACETGLGELGVGDEMVGLVRAFIVAGAARVLASLWPVDDSVTAAFMSSFYGALHAGQSPALALRAAQVDVMRVHPHPFYWAAFTLHGGW
jgi:tetratricopeptide (TPR) repeat protein